MWKNKKNFLVVPLLLTVLFIIFYFLLEEKFFYKGNTAIREEVSNYNYDESQYTKYETGDGGFFLIPKGEAKISVSSNPNEFPRFISGVIDPLDVSPGQTQTIRVVIESNKKIKKVFADIEHDNGIDTIELQFVKELPISFEEIKNSPFVVTAEGVLILNDGKENSAFPKAVDLLFKKAIAESVSRYEYEGQWVVHDTHTKEYKTVVRAEDETGYVAKLVLAWFDPCNINASGYLLGDCNPSVVWGADGLDLDMNGKQITLTGSGSKLVFNPGKSIKNITNGASINTINSGAEIREGYLCYTDADSDTYAPSVSPGQMTYSSTSNCGSGKVRVAFSPSRPWFGNALDCLDSNSDVRPGQGFYFYNSAPGAPLNGWDYNCDGSIQGGWAISTEPRSYNSIFSIVSGLDMDIGSCGYFNFSSGHCGEPFIAGGGCVGGNSNEKNFITKIINFFKPIVKAIEERYFGWYPNELCRSDEGCISTLFGLCH